MLPSGVMVPRSYPVASKAVSAAGSESLLTPSRARSLGQEICRSPGTSANRKLPSLCLTTRDFTISAGRIPRIPAASSRLRAARRSTISTSSPRAAASARNRSRPPPAVVCSAIQNLSWRSCVLQRFPRACAAAGSVAVEQQRLALAAAAAQRNGRLAGSPALELVGRVQGKPCAGGPDRVSQGDGSAVDVAPLQRVVEVLQGLHRHGAESLVDLDEVEVGDGP